MLLFFQSFLQRRLIFWWLHVHGVTAIFLKSFHLCGVLDFFIIFKQSGFSFIIDKKTIWSSSLCECFRNLFKFVLIRIKIFFAITHEIVSNQGVLIIIIHDVFCLFRSHSFILNKSGNNLFCWLTIGSKRRW